MIDPVRLGRIGIIGASLALLAGVPIAHIAVASAQGPSVAERCIHRQAHLIAAGRSPSHKRWTVTASVRNNGSCRSWLLSMDFRPSGTLRGSSRWGWRIPAGGHLQSNFTMNAQDEGAGRSRAFYGATGARVKAVELTMSNGGHLVVHPKLPSLAQRRRFVWLRDVRYFVRYYPLGEHVLTAKLLNVQGEIIGVLRGSEGEFS